ncbi:MAG: nucleotidyltransferase domain-containing protein [Candidatus Aminicenantes bacterium]|nr:nucleotidyltransferase domain-containing protein [Candidatus Aminicenantes bacterium]
MIKIKFSKKQVNLFKKLGIETIYLFGSHAQGNPNPLSDFDFGIVLANPEKYKEKTLDVYLKLYDIFTEILPKQYLSQRFKLREHEFDIVFLQFTPISFQFAVIKNGQVLYERDKENRLKYEEYVIKRKADLKYFHDLSFKRLLERIG